MIGECQWVNQTRRDYWSTKRRQWIEARSCSEFDVNHIPKRSW